MKLIILLLLLALTAAACHMVFLLVVRKVTGVSPFDGVGPGLKALGLLALVVFLFGCGVQFLAPELAMGRGRQGSLDFAIIEAQLRVANWSKISLGVMALGGVALLIVFCRIVWTVKDPS